MLRNLRHAVRYPSLTLGTLLIPVLMLLLFVGVFGGTLGLGFRPNADLVEWVAAIGLLILATLALTSPSTSRAVLQPVRRSPARRASKPRSRGPVISWSR